MNFYFNDRIIKTNVASKLKQFQLFSTLAVKRY